VYQPHPSAELCDLFALKPYQGAEPRQADFLFVGLDANYDEAIGSAPIFSKVLEYHSDGITFWRKYGVHHPFLLPGYSGNGRHYHRTFARVGFTATHAHLVSFVELLNVPTVGRNVLVPSDLAKNHLEWLDDVIRRGNTRHIFISDKVARLMRTSRLFPWLPPVPHREHGHLATWFREGAKVVYSHLHFSVYGKFESRKATELAAIRTLLPATATAEWSRGERR
jgi:hypothetical protein